MSSVRRLTVSGLIVLGVLVGGVVVSASSALALTFSHQLAGYGAPVVPFGTPQGMAVNSNGDLYVADTGSKVVDEFNPSGASLKPQINGAETPATELGSARCVAVNASDDVYVSDAANHAVSEFEPSGKLITQLTEVPESSGAPVIGPFEMARCVAVNASGDVYVLEQEHKVVDEFGPSGEFIMQISGAETAAAEFDFPQDLAVSPEGDVYVSDSTAKVVDEFEPSGKLKTELTEVPVSSGAVETGKFHGPAGVAVDSHGNVYVVERFGNVVDEFSSAGVFIMQLTGVPAGEAPVSGPFKSPEGVAVDAAGDVYVSDTGNKVVDEFSSLPPKVSIGSPSQEMSTSATLSGTIDPRGQKITTCRFEYGTTVEVERHEFKHHQDCTQAGIEGEAPVAVSTTVTGLAPHTIYDYRLSEESISGLVTSSEPEYSGVVTTAVPFTFGAAAFATDVTQFSATLNGALNPENAPASYHFAYIEAAHYNPAATNPYGGEGGAVTPIPDLNAPVNTNEDVVVPQELAGLRPGTTYDFALIASGPLGSEAGPNESFTTPGIPAPVPVTGGVANLSEGAVTLTGSVNPEGWETTYSFAYGTSPAFGQSWPTAPVVLGGLDGAQGVSVYVERLQPNTVYYYTVCASNRSTPTPVCGTTQAFRTSEYPASIIQETPLIPLPGTGPSKKATTKTETNAQKLTAALRACKKDPKKTRSKCEARARKRYAPARGKKKKK